MEPEEREQLKALVNRYGLNFVVNELSILCFQKADTAPESLAIQWRRDGQTLNTILLLLNN